MEQIREQLMYNDNKVHICMRTLTPQEQYECIRLFLATRTKDVFLCSHLPENEYVRKILCELKLETWLCSAPATVR